MRYVATGALFLILAGCATSVPSPPIAGTPAQPEGFTCDHPVGLPGTAADQVGLADARIAGHEGYDRITFDFDSGLPEAEIAVTKPPFTTDPANVALPVAGNAFVRIVFRGTTVGSSSGRDNLVGHRIENTVNLPQLVALRELGDFDGVVSFIAGLNQTGCLRVTTIDDPVAGHHISLDVAAR